MFHISSRWCRWKFRNILSLVLLLVCIHKSAPDCQTDCIQVLTAPEGSFWSPCYPRDYPKNQACRWTLQAPAGFIVQIAFLDFELEEALGCIYDRVVVSTGTSDVTFCGITANGLTLNSSGNIMEVSFSSDFSVQKRGFNISYRQVAVALRNQKVALPQNAAKVIQVSNQVSIPTLQQFTVCFEVARTTQKKGETIFLYTDPSGNTVSFGLSSSGNVMALTMDGQECALSAILSPASFTATMKLFCLSWSSLSGRLNLYVDNNIRVASCAATTGKTITGGGTFRLGDNSLSFDGTVYNFRMWNYAMSKTEFSTLTCDAIGNVIDWDNAFWNIPSGLAQTDSTLSCSTSIPYTPSTAICTSPGPGCPAPLISSTNTTIINNMIVTNPKTNVQYNSTSTTATSMSLTSSTTVVQPPASTANTAISSSTALAVSGSTIAPTSSATNTTAAINSMPKEEVFYRITFVVRDSKGVMIEQNVKSSVTLWLNQTFKNWTYNISSALSALTSTDSSTQIGQPAGTRYTFQALLKSRYTSSTTLQYSVIKERLVSRNQTLGGGLVLETASVQPLENCPAEESPFHYIWPETQPAVTQFLPCFPNKAQSASRTCNIYWQNFTSFWSLADVSNCTDIKSIEVSAENAAEVAATLADITHNELSTDEVSTVVTKLKEIVIVSKMNSSLASTVVNVFSNVMTSSDTALAASSEIVLKTVEELVQKIEFDGPSLSITSRNLALGISAFNSSSFNGTSFSAYIPPNSTDLQINFESQQDNPLAAVTLPATLLSNVSQAEAELISRINFMFFRKTNLFQDQKENGLSLNSYVVASSVGNQSIRNLQDPVRIEIAHQEYQPVPNPVCVFWNFTINNGSGGWSSEGCNVGQGSDSNRTVCLCNHLTNFGILMDISGAAAQIDAQNNKILTFITYIGCGVSAICSAVTLLTYIAFEKLRRDYPSKILMNLSTSLLFLNMVFLIDSWLASFNNTDLCISVAFFLHYFLLTSFTWMGLESVHMYIALVKVFNTYIRRYILKFCIVGWGLPAAIVVTVVAVDRNSYGKEDYGKDEHGQGSSQFCWVKNLVVFYVTCVGYFSVIFLMNVAMFIVVMIQICGRNGKRSNRTLREEMLRSLRSVVSLTFLLGMTWGFAFFAWGPVNLAFMYLFSIFNSLQGLFIFIFHCALKENVQKQWQRYLCCGRFRLADNSDWSKTATNNTKKVSSDNLAKSLSSCSFGSSAANWTSKAKATLNPFAKRSSNAVLQVFYSRLHRQSWDLNHQHSGSKSGSLTYLTLIPLSTRGVFATDNQVKLPPANAIPNPPNRRARPLPSFPCTRSSTK
ncbi:adhesion G-protein coupled receptor G6 isoform X3 [Scleropages formosus]|uniref:adhesion G-protein coupled receptor G6 isoform X3 n=1 Tax=Scleropages formosus TaxID=113540 RepID=UPI0008787482|nr:adhesion G-protein coupled receptor G6 isoform X3 [Scleropages formosus]